MVMVRSLEPQEIADVSVQMCSPSRAGMYQGQWRMCTATGLYYGGEYVLMQARAEELAQHLASITANECVTAALWPLVSLAANDTSFTPEI